MHYAHARIISVVPLPIGRSLSVLPGGMQRVRRLAVEINRIAGIERLEEPLIRRHREGVAFSRQTLRGKRRCRVVGLTRRICRICISLFSATTAEPNRCQ